MQTSTKEERNGVVGHKQSLEFMSRCAMHIEKVAKVICEVILERSKLQVMEYNHTKGILIRSIEFIKP